MIRQLMIMASLLWYSMTAWSIGLPFIRNFSPQEYHGNSLNYDIDIGADGTVFVANFEGLLYYDGVEWRIIYTPGISRITVVYRDQHDVVWVGGYDYFGRVITKSNGELALRSIAEVNQFHGEVIEIWEQDGTIRFLASDGNIYGVKDDKISVLERVSNNPLKLDLTVVIQTDSLEQNHKVVPKNNIIQEEPLDRHTKALITKNHGIIISTDNGQPLYSVTEANGLCSNNVSYVAYNDHGMLWGVTDKGIFCAAVVSAYMRFTEYEGLRSAVQCIAAYKGRMYVGTIDGLYVLDDNRFVPVAGVGYGCWQLSLCSRGLIAATANGVYSVSPLGSVSHLTTASAMSLFVDDNGLYTGCFDGLHFTPWDSHHDRLLCRLEKVTKIIRDKEGGIWIQNLFGEVMHKAPGDFSSFNTVNGHKTMATIVEVDGNVEVVSSDASTPFPYPLYSYANHVGVTWLTNSEGKKLYRWHDGKRLNDINNLLNPLEDVAVRALYQRENELWIGSDNGLIVLNIAAIDSLVCNPKSALRFRSVVLNGDSVLWGGYGIMPQRLPQLENKDRNLKFTYAVDYVSMVGKTKYRYKLNHDSWSVWDEDQDAEFLGLSPGSYTITVQALLPNGSMTDEISMEFTIAKPFYLQWYMNIVYILLITLIIYGLMRYRLIRLKKDKLRLESIVKERTAEVVSQKDEIEQKSISLEKALAELHDAQGELIRQEKMATVGKLTQGLIDRILNPLNYINNFSKLSEGLVKDVEANIEDEKDVMDTENYEDTMDVLGMLRGNLQKVGEHGQHTTRTLKAMEEMLKDRSGGITTVELTALLQQDMEMLRTYFTNDISQYHIQTSLDCQVTELLVKANAEQLSKTFMSLLANAVYAVVKKAQRMSFSPEVKLTAAVQQDKVTLIIYDNGIGIEDTIINKIFDPFFTTKTTAEAAGVGLYLSREIIQNYGGDITVKSRKGDFTEFTITLPLLKS